MKMTHYYTAPPVEFGMVEEMRFSCPRGTGF